MPSPLFFQPARSRQRKTRCVQYIPKRPCQQSKQCPGGISKSEVRFVSDPSIEPLAVVIDVRFRKINYARAEIGERMQPPVPHPPILLQPIHPLPPSPNTRMAQKYSWLVYFWLFSRKVMTWKGGCLQALRRGLGKGDAHVCKFVAERFLHAKRLWPREGHTRMLLPLVDRALTALLFC